MSHHVYTTRGIVLALRSTKESDKVAAIFTRELGLIYTTARGMGKSASKLSTSLAELCIVKVSLVKGRRLWRVTTVTLLKNIYAELREDRDALSSLARVLRLVSTLVKGEEKNAELYDELESGVEKFTEKTQTTAKLKSKELYLVSRILFHLGYLPEQELPKSVEEAEKDEKRV